MNLVLLAVADRLVSIRPPSGDRLVAGLGTRASPTSYGPAGHPGARAALLVIWIGGLVVPMLRSSGLDTEDATFFGSMVEVGVLMFAAGLVGGSWLSARSMDARTSTSQGIAGCNTGWVLLGLPGRCPQAARTSGCMGQHGAETVGEGRMAFTRRGRRSVAK
ncbi:hypothetical protein AQI96_28370 [Streptomyces canus]|nr:hypothetical protein AQI96_28370 [Streptomyces canus]